MGHQGTSADNRPVPSEFVVAAERLSSWKEVAAFFRKDVRTVRRWEAERGLPIHRGAGAVGKSSIYAYPTELERWLRETNDGKADLTELPSSNADQADSSPEPDEVNSLTVQVSQTDNFRALAVTGLAVAVLLSLAGAWWLHLRQAVPPVKAPTAATQQLKQSSNPEAQDLYLRGRYLLSLRTGPSITQAIDLFTQAIVRDPQFAAAYSGLADSYILVREFGHMPDGEAYPRALAASRQALSLDPSLAAAHCSYAFVLNYWQWDFAAAEIEFQRAIALDPNDAQTHHWYATSLFSAGRFQDALREVDAARRLDPDSIAILASRGLLLGMVDPDAARVFLEQLEKANPNFAAIHIYLSRIYERLNDWPSSLHERETFDTLTGDTAMLTLDKAADKELSTRGIVAMNQVFAEGLSKRCDEGMGEAMSSAFFYARLGNAERAVHYLTISFTRHESGFLFLKYEPAFKILETNHDYQKLLLQGNTRAVRQPSAASQTSFY